MNKKVDKLFELMGEIINKTRYSDIDRLKAILTRHQSRIDAQVKQNGYGYTQTRIISYFSNTGMLNELTNGFEYYWFISGLVKQFDEKAKEISDNLIKTASLLFNKENCIAAVTCGKNDFPVYSQNSTKFVNTLPKGSVEYKDWKFGIEKKNEGFLTASKVQYVIKGFSFKKLGYEWSGKMRVLSQILSTDWLQNRIRVIGGAYGGFSTFMPNGLALFNSYRDPNLKETLDNYDAIPDYLDKLEVDDKAMTRYIIGTIAGMDTPLTPSQKGNAALKNYLEKMKKEDAQSDRDAVLSTTINDIKAMKKMVSDILDQKAFCVYGNEAKINSAKDIFNKLETLSH